MKPWDLYTPGNRRAFLSVLFLVGCSNYVDRNVIGVLLEPIKAEFQVSDTMLGLLSGLSFALLYATLGIPVARWADRGDRKQVITIALVAWSSMTVLCGLATTFWHLLAARFGVGAGEAGAVPPSQSLIADYFPPTDRARAIGIFLMSSSAGYVIGLAGGGFIAQHYGWRAVFIFFGLLGFVLLPLARIVLKEPRKALHAETLHGGDESTVAACRALLVKPAYRSMLGALVVYFLMASGALVFIVSLMIRAHGLDVAQAGALFGAVFAIGALIGNFGGGAFADRLAARDVAWLARVGGWGMIVAIPFYELALASSTVMAMLPWLLAGAIAIHAAVPPVFSAVHVVCGSKRRALAIALIYFFANLIGLGLGPVMTGMLSDALGAVYGPAEGLRLSLMVATGALLPAGWLMLRAARTLKADAED